MSERLLSGDLLAAFLKDHYLKLPFAQPGGCRHLCELGAWSLVERILAQPGVDAVIGKGQERWPGETLPSFAQVKRLFEEGYTLGIRHVERHAAELSQLAGEFEQLFSCPVDIHLYCTPAGQPGFAWHYDAEEVFVLQTLGSKEWSLRKNTVNPWPLIETMPANLRYEREIMPMMRCRLEAGDWLYIPSGYWHRTQAGEASISLSVGVLAATGLDLLDYLRTQLLDSLKWRQRVATTTTVAASDQPHAEWLALLADDLTQRLRADTLPDAFLSWRRQRLQARRGERDER